VEATEAANADTVTEPAQVAVAPAADAPAVEAPAEAPKPRRVRKELPAEGIVVSSSTPPTESEQEEPKKKAGWWQRRLGLG